MSAYDNAHRAVVVVLRGKARTHPCADCGGPALDWSLNHKTAAVLLDLVDGEFSEDPADYVARCRHCHWLYDGLVSNLGDVAKFGAANGFFGRHHREESKRYGAENPQAKVTKADVRGIRRRAAAGELQKDLAGAFGLQKMQVSRIVRRERWAHVEA